MSLLLYSILVGVAVAGTMLGAAIGYAYFRARHREHIQRLEGLARELSERSAALDTARAPAPKRPAKVASKDSELRRLREELEQKKNDYRILQQDFDIEVGVLREEIDELRKELSGVSARERRLQRQAMEIDEQHDELRKRLDALRARERDLDRSKSEVERFKAELARQHKHVLEREARMDERLLGMPDEHFSSRQEALLIKRLRQQIKQQRDELEQLHALRRRAASYPE